MSLRMALLGLLTVSGPSSGYDLTKLFERSVNHVWQARHSQIYPELNKMAAGGLVVIEEEGPRGRKTYAVTEEGSRLLREWLLSAGPSRSIRDELALRAFLLPTLEPEEAVIALRDAARICEAKLAELEEIWRTKTQAGKGNFGRYALDLGMRQTRMFRDWARETAEEIERSIRS
ncbi:PadR family transcriptional regulator [Planomonospora sp. ID67723]|uniref:PadR family transcriptional regulator n=1 Tax=Planomonospora sp. ID67723 TaxID=2738134 RepID=UPI0018C364DA|nr:PadR family transcriptional regulator [Planomonospora sp. ID67723]MBG0827918.1 PadR family transcriptional regulator [Planomonospora sp. ID67723]